MVFGKLLGALKKTRAVLTTGLSRLFSGRQLDEAFLEELDGRLTTLRDLCAEERWADLRHEAHTIKGSSATFGAAALSQAAKRIENACDDGQIETIKQDVEAFPALAKKTRAALVKALKLKLSRGQAAA